MRKHLQNEPVKHHSGFDRCLKKHIPPLRSKHLHIHEDVIAGDAPKRFIGIYKFGLGVKANNPNTWPTYIAKVGIKSYPVESITEYLISRIGQEIGLDMAEGSLLYCGNQIRFLSKYFLKKNERLVHGAEILEKYLRDEAFVQSVFSQKKEGDFFTFKVTCEAIAEMFPKHSTRIIDDLFRMLVFDCLIGSQDRHFYNWGIRKCIGKDTPPQFSPIYDTARGLLWNINEDKLEILFPNELAIINWLNQSYVNKSSPSMGIEDAGKVNHFTFFENILMRKSSFIDIAYDIICDKNINRIHELIEHEFVNLFSERRRIAIKINLDLRYKRLLDTIS